MFTVLISILYLLSLFGKKSFQQTYMVGLGWCFFADVAMILARTA